MSDDLEKLAWENERKGKAYLINQRLESIIPPEYYSIVSFEESDRIQILGEGWPGSEEYSIQTLVNEPAIVSSIVSNFIALNPFDFSYIFFFNYGFGLVKVSNDFLLYKWPSLVELDTEQIYCYIPSRNYFICIHRTDEFLKGKEQKGIFFIYEVTFSNLDLKKALLPAGS